MKPAPQVAAAAQTETRQEPKKTTTQPNDTPKAAPTLRLSSIGTSWNNLRQQSKKTSFLPNTEETDSKKGEERQEFSQQDLELQWLAMCNRMPQRLSGIAARMKNMIPVIVGSNWQSPAIEVVVPNEIIKTELEQIRGSVLATLKLHLHNAAISMTLRVAQQEEKAKLLTRREQYELLTKQNAAIEKLRQLFDLELA